jgi:hypothetical protein
MYQLEKENGEIKLIVLNIYEDEVITCYLVVFKDW